MTNKRTSGRGGSGPPSPRLATLTALPDDCRATREARGLSYRAAAAELAMTAADLHRFEHRRGDPKLSTLLRVARWIEQG